VESKYKYSFVIPCYNATESDFRRCLDYIKNQTIESYEVICVDDASLVDTPQIAKEYGFKYIRHDVNKHNGGARNTGIRAAIGDYIIFCNSDDYFEYDTVEQIDKVNNGEDMIIVGFSTFGEDKRYEKKNRFVPTEETTPNISKYNWNGEAMHVVKRQFLLDNSLFELENVPVADRDWTLRLEALKPTYAFVPDKALYNYQFGHEGAIMTDIMNGNIVSNLTNPEHYEKVDKNIDLLIYEHSIPQIGGNTTSLTNFVKHMYKKFNITVLYKSCDLNRLQILHKYARCIMYKGQDLETDLLIWNSSWGFYPRTIKSKKKPIQMLHANYQEVYDMCGFRYNEFTPNTKHVAVSQHVSDVFKGMYNIDSEVMYNMLDPDVKVDKVLRLITATRLTPKKGLDRIIRFAEELKKRNKKYLWFIYGKGHDQETINRISTIENIILMPVSYDLSHYMADAHYLIHLSDTEGDPYCTKEALQVNTPCLTTSYPATYEQITDGENGYILDFDLFENGTEKQWDAAIKKIYTKIPVFKYKSKDKALEKKWVTDILGEPVGDIRDIVNEPIDMTEYKPIKQPRNTNTNPNVTLVVPLKTFTKDGRSFLKGKPSFLNNNEVEYLKGLKYI